MRSLRWVGLVFSLLIVGALGGLMAPLPSEAVSSASINVDSLGEVPLTLYTCTGSIPAGKICLGLTPNSNAGTFVGPFSGTPQGNSPRQFRIKNLGATQARILVSDLGTTGTDEMTDSTLVIEPVAAAGCTGWCTTENNVGNFIAGNALRYGNRHTMTLTLKYQFLNPNTRTTATQKYKIAIGTEGSFSPGPTGAANISTFNDFVRFEGFGAFAAKPDHTVLGTIPLLAPRPSGAAACVAGANSISGGNLNYCPLIKTLGSATGSWTANTSPVPFNPPTLRQGGDFSGSNFANTSPSYDCNNGVTIPGSSPAVNGCTPEITLKWTITMHGFDSVTLANSNDMIAGTCNLTSPDPGGGPSSNPAIPCHSNGSKNLGKKFKDFFDQQAAADKAFCDGEGCVPVPACEGADCVCSDPFACMGTIVVAARVTPAARNLEFPFIGNSGAGIPSNFILPKTDANGAADQDFPDLPASGGPWSISADTESQYNPWPIVARSSTHEYDVDSIDCESVLNQPDAIPPIIVSTWTVDSGSVKKNATVTQLGVNDTVTCTWHIHKTSIN